MLRDYSVLGHRDLGRVLGESLRYSVKPSVEEFQDAKNARVDENVFYNEFYFLSGYAIFYSLAVSLVSSPYSDEVMAGFGDILDAEAKKSDDGAALVRIFRHRLASYNAAAKTMQNDIHAPLSVKMAEFLGAGTTTRQTLELAKKYIPIYYDSHYESARVILKSAKLLK